MPAVAQVEHKDLYPLKAIKTEEEYKQALKSLELVFDETEGPLAEYAETLAILIESYEDLTVIGLMKFRPFFRAMTNKAVTLMRMKRYQEAIETLLLCQSYDELWGVRNMIGECHFCLGGVAEALETLSIPDTALKCVLPAEWDICHQSRPGKSCSVRVRWLQACRAG